MHVFPQNAQRQGMQCRSIQKALLGTRGLLEGPIGPPFLFEGGLGVRWWVRSLALRV